MKHSELFLPEWDQEMAATRKTLQRVPEGKNDWQPHPKSMKLGYLAYLVAALPGWGTSAIEKDSLDLASVGMPPLPTTRKALLQIFDQNVAEGRAAIGRTSDAEFAQPWTLKMGARTLYTKPKHVVLRETVNHLVHHRAQLGVYLRLNGEPVPAIYGPSADEREM